MASTTAATATDPEQPPQQSPRREELWMSDSASQHCLGCLRPFTLTRRRHHCRRYVHTHAGRERCVHGPNDP